MIKENIEIVQKNIEEACKRAGRDRSEVTLIAVSKTKPVSDLREAMDAGMTVFGENKVQEIREKTEEIKGVDFHMIGHLQANKVKYLPGKVVMIHSVDNVKLAQEIEKQFAKADIKIDVLIEVNMAAEDTKFGLSPEEAPSFVSEISLLPHLNIRGLMTIAPYTDDPESNRVYFKGLRELKDKINAMNIPGVNMDTLSMGMTGDYEVAIEEGATFVRVGTGIFGERNYNTKI
ncbi:YggS family pyridoxal phosphate-dependent enzyme [Butyrivibrio sp. CB08]|uniref:YggS family pyridoxal phosphate-dependent enzyme n=1 Tax=Butyrivibrio sp. CB08 TaxID=2364879 RepID=UPI000EA8F1BA|nr:YggS family pyridoxal phosphate-dependent enzyme [Butyrivibrio sp. CB08]RKM62303.1 YggS family pyridoxal phosphate-dependent enzyme [Butyrivibrio sp. CB08]